MPTKVLGSKVSYVIVSTGVRISHFGFARLKVDCTENQRSQRKVRNINNTFGVHNDEIQDVAMSLGL